MRSMLINLKELLKLKLKVLFTINKCIFDSCVKILIHQKLVNFEVGIESAK